MLVGVVGKPNVGKSTFFSAMTMADAEMANYPFTTIEPNKGIGFVRIDCVDKDFGVQCNPRTGYCVEHQRFVPVELVDVAGLVPGAHEGKGLGNKFLDDLRKADVLIHVIDASGSTNEKGEPVALNSYDPANDIKFLEKEIDLWFLGIIKKNLPKISKKNFAGKNDKIQTLMSELSGIGVKENDIDYALSKLNLIEKNIRDWTDEDYNNFATKLREFSKPIVIAANKADLSGAKENIERLKKEFPNLMIVHCSADSELALKKAAKAGLIDYLPGNSDFKELKEVNEAQKQGLEIIRKNVLKVFNNTGVQEILNKAVFEHLKMIAIFPGGTKKLADSQGNVLPDCFLLKPGSTTLDFAFKLHSDIGNNFIKAIDVKTKQLLGKDHKLKHRDVIEIVFNK